MVKGKSGIITSLSRTFSSLGNPVYRLYYGGLMGQRAAMNMQMVARSLLVYRVTGSAAILGLMSLAHALPMLCLSLFGGVIADRIQKKHILLVGQGTSAVISLGIALSLTLGYLSSEHAGSWWILAVAGLLQGIVMGLMMPSRQAIIPEIVGEEQLMNAIALTNMGTNVLRLLTPAVTGFLIAALDFEAVYYTMTSLYLMAVVFISFMPLTGTIAVRGKRALRDIKEGVEYVRRDATILLVLVFTLFAVLLSRPYILMMPVFTEDILKVGAAGMGTLLSVSGIGAIIGSTVLASLPNKKRGVMLLVSSLIMGLALVGFSCSTSWYLSLAVIVFVGLGEASRMTLSNTLLQYYVSDEYRGRVMSIYMMQMGLASLGTFAAGLLTEAMGVQLAIGGFAAVLVLLSILALAFVPRIRRLE
ncbi:MAG: MFS transporter [Chloroflexota bacterium]